MRRRYDRRAGDHDEGGDGSGAPAEITVGSAERTKGKERKKKKIDGRKSGEQNLKMERKKFFLSALTSENLFSSAQRLEASSVDAMGTDVFQ